MKIELYKRLEKTIRDWHDTHNDWPLGKSITLELLPDDNPFGPYIQYTWDISKKKIRNLMLFGFDLDEVYFTEDFDFVTKMKMIDNGEFDLKYDISPMIRFIAKRISECPF